MVSSLGLELFAAHHKKKAASVDPKTRSRIFHWCLEHWRWTRKQRAEKMNWCLDRAPKAVAFVEPAGSPKRL
jgi:hypothetical protein